jgi:SAM-dependent methyltransferase
MFSDKVIRGDGDVAMEGPVNAKHYDALADDYDRQLRAWGYEAPEQGARLLAEHLEAFARTRILDCGCGTGMTGQALREKGARGTIIGVDVSMHSLELAAGKNVYEETRTVDLNATLPFEDDSFDGVLCVGVLSYVEPEPLFREWIRVVRPGGVVVFTSRQDFFTSRGYPELLERIEAGGGWNRLEVTDAMPYLPDHEEFADVIGVIYGVYRVS